MMLLKAHLVQVAPTLETAAAVGKGAEAGLCGWKMTATFYYAIQQIRLFVTLQSRI